VGKEYKVGKKGPVKPNLYSHRHRVRFSYLKGEHSFSSWNSLTSSQDSFHLQQQKHAQGDASLDNPNLLQESRGEKQHVIMSLKIALQQLGSVRIPML